MVFAGHEIGGWSFKNAVTVWGDKAESVIYLGAVDKKVLYSILKQSIAAVLPSRVDNLPNTVIESILYHIPVIGSAGASINELVEQGITGELVPIGDAQALSRAMVKAWRGEIKLCRGPQSAVMAEMQPYIAVKNLLQFIASGH